MYRVKQEDLESRKLKHSFAKNIKMGFQQGQTTSLVFFAMIACVMFPCGAYSIAMMIEALTDIKHTKEGREPKYPKAMRMAIAFGLSSVVSFFIVVVSCISLFHEISGSTTSSSNAMPEDDCCPSVPS